MSVYEDRINELNDKVVAHVKELPKISCCDKCKEKAISYVDGLSDASAMMQGRKPSRPTPQI